MYIREAHPIDEWKMKDNDDQGICYPQPRSLAQRVAIAGDFVRRFRYRIPLAVDAMDNRADALYGAWPERIYVIDEGGRVVYKGKLGPFGFHPEELESGHIGAWQMAPIHRAHGRVREWLEEVLEPIVLRRERVPA